MFFNHQSQNFKVPRMHSPILAASESSAKEEDVKWLEFMDNHHEQCDISKCMGKRINGLFACQFTSIPGSMYSQYLRHRRRMGSYKTKPCRYVFEQWRSCLAGEDCPFYHSLEEKRDIPQPALQPAIFDFVPQHNAEPCLLDELILQVHETTERMYKQALNTEEFLRVLDNDQVEGQRQMVPNKHRAAQLWEFNANLNLAAPFVPAAINGNHKNNNNGREYQCGVNGLMRFDSGMPSSDVMGNWGDCSTSSHSNSPPRSAFSRTIGPKKKHSSVLEDIAPNAKAASFDPFAEFYPLKDLAIVGTRSSKSDEQNWA